MKCIRLTPFTLHTFDKFPDILFGITAEEMQLCDEGLMEFLENNNQEDPQQQNNEWTAAVEKGGNEMFLAEDTTSPGNNADQNDDEGFPSGLNLLEVLQLDQLQAEDSQQAHSYTNYVNGVEDVGAPSLRLNLSFEMSRVASFVPETAQTATPFPVSGNSGSGGEGERKSRNMQKCEATQMPALEAQDSSSQAPPYTLRVYRRSGKGNHAKLLSAIPRLKEWDAKHKVKTLPTIVPSDRQLRKYRKQKTYFEYL